MSTVQWSMQQKRDTAANWTANNPTLLAGQIGFETDTNKIKIGDGSTAWTGLSYFAGSGGGGETLAQTLALGSTTGGTPITVSNNDYIQSHVSNKGRIQFLNNGQEVAITTDGTGYVTPYLYLSQSQAQLVNGSEAVTVQAANIDLYHSSLIKLRATDVELTNETASRILSTDGSKYITALDTATYPSLTELTYVKGVTSAIQTQLNNKNKWIPFFSVVNNALTDGTTYYISQGASATIPTTTTGQGAMPIPAGTITQVVITTYNASTVGSNENCTVNLVHGVSFGTTSLITSTLTVDANRQALFNITGLSISVVADCNAFIQLVIPTLATNPNAFQIRGFLVYQ